jgi:hypothetical protein
MVCDGISSCHGDRAWPSSYACQLQAGSEMGPHTRDRRLQLVKWPAVSMSYPELDTLLINQTDVYKNSNSWVKTKSFLLKYCLYTYKQIHNVHLKYTDLNCLTCQIFTYVPPCVSNQWAQNISSAQSGCLFSLPIHTPFKRLPLWPLSP